jgi:DNA-directed RNA polymerase subunit RPC12/RpoP
MINLKCVNCGAGLEISQDMETFACGYCGTQQMVERKGGTIALRRVTDAISKVQAGTDRTAAELTLKRLSEEMAALNNHRAHIQMMAARRRDCTTLVVNTLVFGTLAGFIGAAAIGNKDAALPVFFTILVGSAVLAYFLRKKRQAEVDAALQPQLAAINQQESALKVKIGKNRAIADS